MTLHSFGLFILMLISCSTAVNDIVNDRPIIGIVSESRHEGGSYIAASYVKYLESAGARVVPILNNSTNETLDMLFKSINGVLFPGGGVSLKSSYYERVGTRIYKLAKEANDNDDYFPLWGTCLGFELLCVLEAGPILTSVDALDYPLPLMFTDGTMMSRLFSSFPLNTINWLTHEAITFNNHVEAVTPEVFNEKLGHFYSMLSTNKDRQGKTFVSTMEAHHYPFYGVQWHPEKSLFEWNTKEHINHTSHAVLATQSAADFFVHECRKSKHSFPSPEEEEKALIYNYQPVYTGKDGSSFEQQYIFK